VLREDRLTVDTPWGYYAVNMKYILIVGALVLIVFVVWKVAAPVVDPDVAAEHGLHWHAHLTIEVDGKNVPIQADIGLGAEEKPIHTHDTDGVIHMEFPGEVHQKDLELRQFFKEWGRDITSFGPNMHMQVNGATSTEYGRYVMHDGDEIVLQYN